MDLLEYQGKQLFARHGVPGAHRRPRHHRRGGRRRRRRDRLPLRRQGAGADRRPRQGRRHQGRQGPGRGRGARQGDPRHGHPRPHRPRGVDRGGVGHRVRVLRVDRLRPLGQAPAGDALDAGRHGHRGGRRATTRTRSPACTSTRCSASRTSTPAGSPSRPASTPTSCARSARCSTKLYDAFVAEEAMLVEVNPLIVTRRPPGRWRSTPRSRSTTTRSSATPTTPRCATTAAEDPQERMARERGLTYVKLDGNVGILGNGAGLVMSTLDVVAQAGGSPGELPRRRRRLEGRGDHAGRRGDPLQRERHRRAVQHLRRHHALRRGREGPDRGVRPDQARPCRSSCASTGPTTRRAARCWPRPTCPTCTPRRRCSAPRERVVELGGDEHPRRQRHAALRLRHHRPRGHVPHAQQPALRHQRGRRA